MRGHDSSDYEDSQEPPGRTRWWNHTPRPDSQSQTTSRSPTAAIESPPIRSPPDHRDLEHQVDTESSIIVGGIGERARRESVRLRENPRGGELTRQLVEPGGYLDSQFADSQYFPYPDVSGPGLPPHSEARREPDLEHGFQHADAERAARIHQEIVDAHLTLARLHAELVAMHQSTTLLSPTYPLSAPHLSEAFKLAHPSPSVDPGPRHPHQLAPSTKIEDDVSVSRADFTEVSSDPQFNPIDDHDSDGIVNSTPISELESESSVEVWPTKDHINGEILYLAAHQQSQQVLFTESCPYIPDPVEWPGAKCPEEDSQSDSEAKGTQYYYSAGRSKPTPRRPLMATIYSDL